MKATITPTPTSSRAPKAAFESWGPDSLTRWAPAAFPDGQGGTWTWAEPTAQVQAKGGNLGITVPRFERSHDHVQIFDNPKHLLAGSRQIPVPPEGVRVEVTLAAELLHGDASSWDNGFASFNLMDFQGGYVLDGLANGKRTAILFERLHIPGMVPLEQSWTTIADGPASTPGQEHRFAFEIDPAARRIQGWIDGKPVLDWRNAPSIASFTPGVGLITLSPIANGRSTSLKGQGASARFGTVHVLPRA